MSPELSAFIRKSIESGKVWMLAMNDQIATWHFEDEDKMAFIFWSDLDMAEQVRSSELTEHKSTEILLSEFLFGWLPNLADMEAYVGFDWINDEHRMTDPEDLIDSTLNQMPEEMRKQYLDLRNSDPRYCLLSIGTYANFEAKELLDIYEKHSIRYELGVDDSKIKGMSDIQAAYGGSTGDGSGISISIHFEDIDKAIELRNVLFGLEEFFEPGHGPYGENAG